VTKREDRNAMDPAAWDDDARDFGAKFDANSFVVQGSMLYFELQGDSYSIQPRASNFLPVTGHCNSRHTAYTMIFKDFEWVPEQEAHVLGEMKVTCNRKNRKIFFNCLGNNKNEDECSWVICFDPKHFCTKRFPAIGKSDGWGHCDKSCAGNGRCQPDLPRWLQMGKRRLIYNEQRDLQAGKVVESSVSLKGNVSNMVMKLHDMNPTRMKKYIKKYTEECKGMSKTAKCGPGHGFCEKGFCSASKHECSDMFKNDQDPKYAFKHECRALHWGKTIQANRRKERKRERNHALKICMKNGVAKDKCVEKFKAYMKKKELLQRN